MARYAIRPVGVYDSQTSQAITPMDDVAWAEYDVWLRQGNIPDPYVPPPPPAPTQAELDALAELADRDTMRDNLRADATIEFLRTHTPAEVAAWVNTNVTDLASARTVLSKLAMIVAYLARERLARP
jgi:hypothetical protein